MPIERIGRPWRQQHAIPGQHTTGDPVPVTHRARARGETIVPVSEKVADAVEIGMLAMNRAERRAQQFQKNANREQAR